MDKGFQFVDGTCNDRLTRRLARSHAMKGKNLGRKLTRRSRIVVPKAAIPKCSVHESKRLCANQSVGVGSGAVTCSSRRKTQDARPWSVLSERSLSGILSMEVSVQSNYMIKEFMDITFDALYPQALCRSIDKAKAYSIRLFFADQTAYHCSVAVMATLSASILGRESLPPEAFHHLNYAVRYVNESLATDGALTDSTVSIVNLLVLQGMIREDELHAKTHLDGLRTIVRLRGGLGQMEQNRMLQVKICKTELDYALHYGTSTFFYRDHMSEVALALAADGFPIDRTLPQSPTRFSSLHPALHQIFVDATQVAALFNQKNVKFGLEPHILQEFIVSLGGRLNRFHPLRETPLASPLESACHIGLTAFISTLFLQRGCGRSLEYVLVTKCVEDAVERGVDDGYDDVLLWLLFIGGVAGLSELCGLEWIGARIRRVSRLLGIRDWMGVRGVLGRFAWIGSHHDGVGRALWESVLGHFEQI